MVRYWGSVDLQQPHPTARQMLVNMPQDVPRWPSLGFGTMCRTVRLDGRYSKATHPKTLLNIECKPIPVDQVFFWEELRVGALYPQR